MRINRKSKIFLYCQRIAFQMRKIFDEHKNFILFLGVLVLIRYEVIGLWLAAGVCVLLTVLWDFVFNKETDNKTGGENE